MPSDYEKFWENESFAVVGLSSEKKFPVFTYRGLKASGKSAFPIDSSKDQIEGDKTYPDFTSLPSKVDAAVLEVPKSKTEEWVQKALDAGVKNIWLHMNTDTPEAISLAEKAGATILTGNCGAMYATPGVSFHSIHKVIWKLLGKY